MFDLKKWSEESPVAAWSSVIFTGVLAVNGAVNGALDIYSKYSALNKPTKMMALIERADFQSRSYDEIDISFRNPTDKAKSVNDLSLICNQYDGKSYVIHSVNSSPKQYSLVKGLEHTPINIAQHSSKTVKAAFMKIGGTPAVTKRCKTVSALWSDSSFKSQVGDEVQLKKDMAYFVQTIYK